MDKDTTTNPFGHRFAQAMAQAGRRPRDIAELTGASQSTVGNWKRRGVSEEYAGIVADFLQVDPADISQTLSEAIKLQKKILDLQDRTVEEHENALAARAEVDRLRQDKAVMEQELAKAERVSGAPPARQGDMMGFQVQKRDDAPLRQHPESFSVRRYRNERLLEIIEQANLSHRDQDFIEDLIFRLSQKQH